MIKLQVIETVGKLLIRIKELSREIKLTKSDVQCNQKLVLLYLKGQSVSVRILHDFLATFWVTNKGDISDAKNDFITWISNNCLGIQDTG